MYLSYIELREFRNYEEQTVNFHPKVNVITGDNAQGKTNLLEAIYVLSLGKSFRTSKDFEMIRFGHECCMVKGKSLKQNEELKIEIAYFDKKKSIKVNGYKISRTIELLENMYIVVFSPEDLKIIKDEPEKRRKFVDRELCQLKPVYYSNLGRYKKILQHRNVLLKQGERNHEVIGVWNEELAEYGSKIILERNNFIEKIGRISSALHEKITDGKEKLEIFYESSVEVKGDSREQKSFFVEKLEKSFKNDLFRGNTSFGPHKDDLKICIDGVDIRHFGSQGQQRTAALSLKLAELNLIKEETGENAILLLDDVLSELDGQRQKFLMNRLNDVQIFITTTEIGETLSRHMPEGYVFSVKNGSVKNVSG